MGIMLKEKARKIPLNLDNSIHDCMLNPYNRARKEDHEMKK
jgi:hypothetical protein